MPQVNPAILVWARETAGLSVDAAAKALGLGQSKLQTGADKLAAMERGESEVSRSTLAKMSDKYHRSLVVFYLSQAPSIGDRGTDFRRRPGSTPIQANPLLDALIRDILSWQDTLKSALEDEDAEPVPFVGSARDVNDPTSLGRLMQEATGFQLDEFRRMLGPKEAFDYLREKIEAIGVFVLLAGNLGSHHTNIDAGDFSGYAIADLIAPFIVVNDHDSRTAWSFTALHELAHVFLGSTGISAGVAESGVEKLCNDAAAALLLRPEEIRAIDTSTLESMRDQIDRRANEWNVSRSMVAYNLLTHRRIDRQTWAQLNAQLRDDYLAAQTALKNREEPAGGPSYYVVKRHRLGAALLATVRRSLLEGSLTQAKAGRVLGVSPRNIEPLTAHLDYPPKAS